MNNLKTTTTARILHETTLALALLAKPNEVISLVDERFSEGFELNNLFSAAGNRLKDFWDKERDCELLGRIQELGALGEIKLSSFAASPDSDLFDRDIRALSSVTRGKKILSTFFVEDQNQDSNLCGSLLRNLKVARHLDENDLGVFVLPPFWYCFIRGAFDQSLRELGLEVQAVLETPIVSDEIYKAKLTVVVVQKRKSTQKTFFGRLQSSTKYLIYLRDWAPSVLEAYNDQFFSELDNWLNEELLTASSHEEFDQLESDSSEIPFRDLIGQIQRGPAPRNPDYPEIRGGHHQADVSLVGEYRGFALEQCQGPLEAFGSMEGFEYLPIGQVVCSLELVPSSAIHVLNENQFLIGSHGAYPNWESYRSATEVFYDFGSADRFWLGEVDPEVISRDYLISYMRSKHGRNQLKAHREDVGRFGNSFYPNLFKILLPLEVTKQSKFVEAQERLKIFGEVLEDLEETLSMQLHRLEEVSLRLVSLMEPVGKLSEAEKVRLLIEQGESKELEFKSTFSFDTSGGTKNVRLITASLKTLVAFMNSDGGTLLVGVDDAGMVIGVDLEVDKLFRGNSDKFLLNVKDHIKSKIGEEFYPLIDYSLVKIEGKRVLRVKCQPSTTEVFLDGKDFYVRTNPATDKLEGKKLAAYIRMRFSSNF